MNHPNYKYIDVALGNVSKRNDVRDITTFNNYTGQTDCYRTVFRFDKDYLEHFEKNNTVAGFKGKCYADFLPIDIDSENLIDAYKKAKYCIYVLKVDYDYEVQYLFFSGKKGFHILLPSECFGIFEPSEKLPGIFKNIMQDIYGKCDLAIYEINRLFRLTNTKHSGSGLFKIPLIISDFDQGIEYITELAKEIRQSKFYPFSENVKNIQFYELYQKYKFNGTVREIRDNTIYQDFKGVGEGHRDSTATKICGILKSKNMESELVLQILKGWNLQNDPPLSDTDLLKILHSVYRYNDTSELSKHIIPAWALYDEYKEFVLSDKKINIGIPEIDTSIRGIRPQQVMTIMGFTGNFKSALLQDILRHFHNYSKQPVLLFQLEMSRLDLYERAVQMEMGLSGNQVEEMFKQNDNFDKQDVISIMQKSLEHFYFVDRSGLSFKDIEKYIQVAEQEVYKRKTGLVGIDFVQLMSGLGQTEVQIMSDVAKNAKQFAKNLDVPVILLSQTTGVDDAETAIRLMDSRYSKTLPIMGDYVIGIWIEKENEKTYQVMELLKNRKGRLTKIKREIFPDKLQFGESFYYKSKPKKELPFDEKQENVF